MKRIDTEQAARERLINLAELMSDMAEEDMGWLTAKQAATFHRATHLINSIIRATK